MSVPDDLKRQQERLHSAVDWCMDNASSQDWEPEPRWPAVVAGLTTGTVYLTLPPELRIGPSWLLLALVAGLLVPATFAHRTGRHHLNYVLGFVISGVTTLFLIYSVLILVRGLFRHSEMPGPLLTAAVALWVTNVLVFAVWYWRLDAGGPHGRDQRRGHPTGAFLFPQMTLDAAGKDHDLDEGEAWSPQFIDYLFLAFNTSTALSPTDAPVLSRWAKVLVMLQATISLTIIVLLAARAVNIL